MFRRKKVTIFLQFYYELKKMYCVKTSILLLQFFDMGFKKCLSKIVQMTAKSFKHVSRQKPSPFPHLTLHH